MSIQKRTKLGGIAVIAAIVVSIGVGTWSINEIRMGGSLYEESEQISDLTADILPPPAFVVEPYLEMTLIADHDGNLDERLSTIEKLHKEYLDRKGYWEKQDLPEKLRSGFDQAESDAEAFWSVYYNNFLPAMRANDTVRFEAAHDEIGAAYVKHRQHIQELVREATAYQQEIASEDSTILFWSVAAISALALTIIAMVSGAVWYMLRRVLGPVSETVDTMTRMAGGDLEAGRTSEHREDEIGAITRAIEVFRDASIAQRESESKQRQVVEELSGGLEELASGNLVYAIETPLAAEYEGLRISFNNTVEQLRDLLRSVAASAQGVATGAGEIRAASDDLAMRNEQQAASLEETAAAMNQVTGIVKETADGAVDVQKKIADAHKEASDGGYVVERAVSAMSEIEKSAQEITQIINLIDGIAFQTNLLALNAGVEAARAGDAGKGFAVVANEVRALAQRSADAARDIKELITASTEQVAGGVRLVGETGELLSKIVTRVGEINTMVGEIVSATEHQAANLQQVNSAVSEMDRMTQQNAAMVEQSTAAARNLADEASELAHIVGRFRTGNVESIKAAPPRKVPGRVHVPARPVKVSGNLAVAAVASEDDWTEF